MSKGVCLGGFEAHTALCVWGLARCLVSPVDCSSLPKNGRTLAHKPNPASQNPSRKTHTPHLLPHAPTHIHIRRYTTLNHIKYCLPNGDNGIIRTLDTPLYITRVAGNTIYALDRDGKTRAIQVGV